MTEGSFRIDDLPPGTYALDLRAGDGTLTDLLVEVSNGRVAEPPLPPLEPRATTETAAENPDTEASDDSPPAGDG